jgi:hypothetical protein
MYGLQRGIAWLSQLHQETPECAKQVSMTSQEFPRSLEQCSMDRLYNGSSSLPAGAARAGITEVNGELFKPQLNKKLGSKGA